MQSNSTGATQRSSFDRAMLFIGSLAYVGFVPFASGTVAVAVVGVPLYLLLALVLKLAWPTYLAFNIGLTLLAVFIAGHADRVLSEKDSKKNVIDELPGYLIALTALPVTWQIVTLAFFLERIIDIAKVWPANWIEKHLPGGWGVVLDDVVAGIYTWVIVSALVHFLPGWMGLN